MRRFLALAGLLALTACDAAPAGQHKDAGGTLFLRVVYRDGDAEMVLMVPEKGGQISARGDCAAPLLIDDTNGSVRQVGGAEARDLVRHMELSGAVQGTCPTK